MKKKKVARFSGVAIRFTASTSGALSRRRKIANKHGAVVRPGIGNIPQVMPMEMERARREGEAPDDTNLVI
jgi:hypothetical protein